MVFQKAVSLLKHYSIIITGERYKLDHMANLLSHIRVIILTTVYLLIYYIINEGNGRRISSGRNTFHALGNLMKSSAAICLCNLCALSSIIHEKFSVWSKPVHV